MLRSRISRQQRQQQQQQRQQQQQQQHEQLQESNNNDTIEEGVERRKKADQHASLKLCSSVQLLYPNGRLIQVSLRGIVTGICPSV
jgi:transcription initiation factor TFIID subunit TAF12